MSNTVGTDVSLCDEFKRMVEDDTILEIASIQQGHASNFYEVDLSVRLKTDQWSTRYYIELRDTIPLDKDLVFLFPNHPNPKMRVLRTIQYGTKLESLQAEIYPRFKDSHETSPQYGDNRLIVLYGKNAYTFKNIQGTIYLFWAKFINSAGSGSSVITPIARDQPVIGNLSGSSTFRSLFWLRHNDLDEYDLQVIPTGKKSLTLAFHGTYFPFVHEGDTRQPKKSTLVMVNEEKVHKSATIPFMQTDTTDMELHNVFAESDSDDDDSSGAGAGAIELDMGLSFTQPQYTVIDGVKVLGILDGPLLGKDTPTPNVARPGSFDMEHEYPDIGTHRPGGDGISSSKRLLATEMEIPTSSADSEAEEEEEEERLE